jgi:hypothetical protein
LICVTIFVGVRLAKECPERPDPLKHQEYRSTSLPLPPPHSRRVPWMPFCPLFGIFVNYFLVAQLVLSPPPPSPPSPLSQSWEGLLLILLYFGVAVVFYFSYSVHHSVGNQDGWADLLAKLEKSGDRAFLSCESSDGNGSSSSLQESLLRKS